MILDTTKNCEIFFEYKATMREFHKEMVGVIAKTKTTKSAIEPLRHSLVYSMRAGDRLVINVDKLIPDFKTEYNFDVDLWPSN